MDLERFDPRTDAERVHACHEIYLAGARLDDPYEPPMSLPGFRAWQAYGWSEDPSESWLARDVAGAPCGWFVLTLPQRENRRYGYLKVCVHPARRQAGLGRALTMHAAARAVRAGRALLAGDTREGSPGEAFARAIGAQQGMFDLRRVLWLSSLSAARLASLRGKAEAAAAGYSLLQWEGPVPPEHHEAIAAITAAADDMPIDAGHEPQRWDADRVRAVGQRVTAHGLHYYTVAARHDASGELVGFTQLGVDPLVGDFAYQELTAVARPHRGHRLGLLVKVAMLQWLAEREPQLEQIMTGNADGNEHMIAINDELGFHPLDRWSSWEMDVAAAVTLRPCA